MIDFAVEKMEEALSAQFAGIDAELACLFEVPWYNSGRPVRENRLLKYLTDALAQGRQSQSIMAAIGEPEEELRSITDRLLEPRAGSLRAKLEELRTFAVSRLTKIRELLAHPEDVEKAHEAIAERVGRLTLEATNENGKRTYLAHGKVDFFGEEDLAHSSGAGCPACTTRYMEFQISLAACGLRARCVCLVFYLGPRKFKKPRREMVCGGASLARKGDQRRCAIAGPYAIFKDEEELKPYVWLWNGSRELAAAAAN